MIEIAGVLFYIYDCLYSDLDRHLRTSCLQLFSQDLNRCFSFVGAMGLNSVISMTGHKDLKLADHYSKIDGEVQKATSLKILDHIGELGLQESRTESLSNVVPFRRVK